MSRRAGESNVAGEVEWAQADLRTGAGLAEAMREVDVVLHAATSSMKDMRETDIEGTRRLLEAAKTAGVSNFYYVSIVGIDKVNYPYYKAKLEAEQMIEASGVPFTVLRATQFHPLLGDIFLPQLLRRGPFLIVPGSLKFQLIDPGEVAEHIVASLARGASGRLPDIGGPQVQTLAEIARDWKKASGRRLITVPIPALGWMKAFAAGENCCPDNVAGKITWREWLAKRFGTTL
jgi:uncharacterized protein YbjT (DUF2867 family)